MTGLMARSILVYLSALAFMANWGGGEKDNSGDFRVRRVLEGRRRSRPAVPDKRRSITLRMLKGLTITFSKLWV